MYEVNAIEMIASMIVAENSSSDIAGTVKTMISENSEICARDAPDVKEFLLS